MSAQIHSSVSNFSPMDSTATSFLIFSHTLPAEERLSYTAELSTRSPAFMLISGACNRKGLTSFSELEYTIVSVLPITTSRQYSFLRTSHAYKLSYQLSLFQMGSMQSLFLIASRLDLARHSTSRGKKRAVLEEIQKLLDEALSFHTAVQSKKPNCTSHVSFIISTSQQC